MKRNKVLIIGGGIAGLTAAIHLSRRRCDVTVIDKHSYPRHKVCGEYVSNEVLPYLESLGIQIEKHSPSRISRTQISTAEGKSVIGNLPLGGFGLSRYELDNYLYKTALVNGCKVIQETVTDVDFSDDQFTVTLSNSDKIEAKVVLGAFGKRSNIDQKLNRTFIAKKSPWLAVKAHFRGEFPNDLVALHNFKGGYCGVSKVENDIINICYLADYESFKAYKNIDEFEKAVLYQNPHLKEIFEDSEMIFEKPITISQISFDQKDPVENHILMIGDSGGLINPLCGNGMAIAIHTAKIASELAILFMSGIIPRDEFEKNYTNSWNQNFKNRMRTGRALANLLQKETLSQMVMHTLTRFPSLLPGIIKQTHGEPIEMSL